MEVIVDTPIWSLLLRRRSRALNADQRASLSELRDLVAAGLAVMIGPVPQELLTGLDRDRFESVRKHLAGFDDVVLESDDFVDAARGRNLCSENGIQGSPIDFLICSVALRRGWSIFTTDADFQRYAKCLPIRLYKIA